MWVRVPPSAPHSAWTAHLGATRFINERSRLVVDPERFADDAYEPMARVGQGAVYVWTTDGRVLRDPTPTQRDELLERFYRPDFCIGTDTFPTPLALVETLSGALLQRGYSVEIDRPFAGALVPLTWHGRDRRVSALMIETRRGLYCDGASGRRNADFDRIAADIERPMTETLQALGWR